MSKTIDELLVNEVFIKELFKTKNADEVKGLFEKNDIKISDEDATGILNEKTKFLTKLSTLDEKQLENISGGVIDPDGFESKIIGAGAITGMVAGFSKGMIKFIKHAIQGSKPDESNEEYAKRMAKDYGKIWVNTGIGALAGTGAAGLGIAGLNQLSNKQSSYYIQRGES